MILVKALAIIGAFSIFGVCAAIIWAAYTLRQLGFFFDPPRGGR